MNRRLIRKTFKIIGGIFLVLFLAAVYLVYAFTSPNSEADIVKKFQDERVQPSIHYEAYKDHSVRIIGMQKEIDSLLPTLFFVHGSPGSSMDFQRYLKDEELNSIANLFSYDRIGYGPERTGEVLNSLQEEVELLHQILEGIDIGSVILVGYSYGGTVVMASELGYKKKIALAAAVKGELEPMFWAMNLYRWELTRPLVPKVFRGASIEKFRHVKELGHYKEKWGVSDANVLSIHGKKDVIVPFENSLFLNALLDKDKFTLIPLDEGNHSLIWTNFDLIKKELIKSISENEF